jgi:hypothetical protein
MTIFEDARDVANKITDTLPPAFVALLFINLMFILGMLWFMHDLAVARIEAITRIFQACTSALSR